MIVEDKYMVSSLGQVDSIVECSREVLLVRSNCATGEHFQLKEVFAELHGIEIVSVLYGSFPLVMSPLHEPDPWDVFVGKDLFQCKS